MLFRSFHYRPSARMHCLCKRTTKYLLNHKMTQCATYTTPDLPPTLAARLALCKGIHSNKHRQLKSSQPTANIQLRLLRNHNPNSIAHRFLSYASHYIKPTSPPYTGHSIHNAAAAKSSAVLYTQLSLILHSCPLPVW